MARHRDNSPVPQTCPMIDWVINEVASIYNSNQLISGGENTAIESKMEKIRAANSELREWGNEQCNKAIELDDELDEANREISRLQQQIADYKQEILELSKESVS